MIIRRVLRLALALGQALQALVDLGVRHVNDGALELERLEVHRRDVWNHFHRNAEFEVLAVLEAYDLDLGLAGRTQVALVEQLVRTLMHRLLQHLAHHRLLVALLQQLQRHLARTETRHADPLAQLLEARLDLSLERVRGDDDLVFTLEAGGVGFRDLHGRALSARCWQSGRATASEGRVVRAEGLEPPRLASLEPKSSASASSATPARRSVLRRHRGCRPALSGADVSQARRRHKEKAESAGQRPFPRLWN